MKAGVDYYTASISFDQDDLLRCTVRLIFLQERPKWLRVYEAGPAGVVKLVKDLGPARMNPEGVEYLDAERSLSAKSVRLYVFLRSARSNPHEDHVAGVAIGSR
jgi:hypothetical protein